MFTEEQCFFLYKQGIKIADRTNNLVDLPIRNIKTQIDQRKVDV